MRTRNPVAKDYYGILGISREAALFFHVMILACLFLPSPLISAAERESIAARNRWSTLCGSSLREGRCRAGAEERRQAAGLFDAMAAIASRLGASYAGVIADRREQWDGDRPRPINRLREALSAGRQSQLELGLTLARQHYETLVRES